MMRRKATKIPMWKKPQNKKKSHYKKN